MSKFTEQIGMETGNYFKAGYNCGESIIHAFRMHAGVDISDNAFRLASAFGGGCGHARDFCGAMAGSVMVISTLVGRNSPEEKKLDGIYPYSKEFQEIFVEKFGSTNCGDLMPYEFDTREHYINCMKLVNKVATALAEFLIKKGLIEDREVAPIYKK